MTLRVLIADDEAMARRRLARLLGALPGMEVVGEARDGAEVLARVAAGGVDLVLLDIQMPGLTGVETLQLLGDRGPAVIFTTAHSEHALAAFEGGAADYLLKPVEPARLLRALERAKERLFGRNTPTPPRAAERLPLPTRAGIVLLDPSEILHVSLEGASTVVSTVRGRFFSDLRLADLERRLGSGFERVHRQALVNRERVQRLEDVDSGGYLAIFEDGSKVPVSRQVAREWRRAWGDEA